MLSYYVYVTNFLADRLRRDDRGATMVEYGLMLALIAAVCVVIIGAIGGHLNTMFKNIDDAITGA
jgi:pilus assembly protein Flp/PilA